MTDSEHFTVVGAGLGGSLMALFLGRDGHEVDLYERRPDPRSAGAEAGRSINLAISARGLNALERVGLKDEILAMAVPMRGRMIHPARGKLAFQPYGTKDQAINSVSRAGLNTALLDAAERQANLRIHFDQRLVDLDFDRRTMVLTSKNGEQQIGQAGTIIGADGAFSAVRSQLQRRDRFRFSPSYLAHGYKELYIPPASGGGFRMEPNALHIWPRGGFMMIALPNHDGSFTCTLFWPYEGPNSFAAVATPRDVLTFFEATYPDALPHLPTLVEDFFSNPTSSLVTIRCSPWHLDGRAVLLGDAAHAVVPFYGQGANAAFEDCVELDACLREYPGDSNRAFLEFEARRRVNADAIADLALANFVEMRDRVSSPLFLVKKKVEKVLHALFPRWFIPLYTMISFTRIPYAAAVDRAARQDRVLRWVSLLLLAGVVFFLVALFRG
jgi:kynurenine 3-monooxygenase